MDLRKKLTEVFREVFYDDEIAITPDMTANDIDGWDSFAHMNLISLIEIKFNIEITDEEVVTLKNVGDILVMISNKKDR
jgi:acyl carrier protein